ncbi:MAG: permease [Betaproteobacteria bacterium]|nr:permease [Betaproteobacteria bacterium]
MSSKLNTGFCRVLLTLCCLSLAACATAPPVEIPEPPEPPAAVEAVVPELPVQTMLAYYASNPRPQLQFQSQSKSARQRQLATDPYLQLQLAIRFGQARPPDLQRASNLLEQVMKSTHPMAANLVPLARVLHDQYGERLRLEAQLREAQRRGDELQEKIEALSEIERSLPVRPLPTGLPGSTQ